MTARYLPLGMVALLAAGAACTRTTTATEQAANTAAASQPIAGALPAPPTEADGSPFRVVSEQFADLRVLRYYVPGFEKLPAKRKELLYYLSEAALCGRDIIYDQNYKNNLAVRRTLEAIWPLNEQRRLPGNGTAAQRQQAQELATYCKRVWFSNGMHHHYSTKKFVPGCTPEYFATLVRQATPQALPLLQNESVDKFLRFITPVIFDPNVAPKRVNLTAGQDLLRTSATNFYEGVSQREVEAYYARRIDKNAARPISYGLNSKLEKAADGTLQERPWKLDGLYGPALAQVVYWLGKAEEVAETAAQHEALGKLIRFYTTGDLRTWDDYNVAWVHDTESAVDAVSGFVEVYGDPLGYRGSYESVVSFRDEEATRRIKALAEQAQWFEDNSPIKPEHKKKNVVGITAKVITVVQEAGDAAPNTPIGINLPNANWIRKEYGSKSVSLGNIVDAYEQASASSGLLEEFAGSPDEIGRAKQYGSLAGKLHTDLHEVVGHASGQLNPGVGTPKETLKSYASALEEARADLVALYYLPDPKLQQLGVVPSADVAKAEYDNYLRNGLLTQLARLQPGENLEEAHMRNRQMVSRWVLTESRGRGVALAKRNGKTYVEINDYARLRELFGQLLREVQRLTSEGDYAAGRALIETYGVKVDPELHREVLARYQTLGIAPYQGFIQPRLVPVQDAAGQISDVRIEYPKNFAEQMLEYGKKYRYLPNYN